MNSFVAKNESATKNEVAAVRELDVAEIENVAGARSLSDHIHRILFALSCVAGGNKLTIKGDQLQCRL